MTEYYAAYRLPFIKVQYELGRDDRVYRRAVDYLRHEIRLAVHMEFEDRNKEEPSYGDRHLVVSEALFEFCRNGDLPLYSGPERVPHDEISRFLPFLDPKRGDRKEVKEVIEWMKDLSVLKDDLKRCLERHNFALPPFWYGPSDSGTHTSPLPHTERRGSALSEERLNDGVKVAVTMIAEGETPTNESVASALKNLPEYRDKYRGISVATIGRSFREAGGLKKHPNVKAALAAKKD